MKNLEQLLEDLRADEELRAKLAAAGEDEASVNAVLAEEGFAVTVADMKSYAEQNDISDPTDDELRKVAGGADGDDVYSAILIVSLGCLGGICWSGL